MGCSWVRGAGERTGGRGVVRFGVAVVLWIASRSANPVETLASAARFVDYSADQSSLVRA